MNSEQNLALSWQETERLAEELVPILGRLSREKQISLTIFGRPLSGCTVIEILKLHKFARHLLGAPLSLQFSLQTALQIEKTAADGRRIDLGELARADASEIAEIIAADVVAPLQSAPPAPARAHRRPVILYGFGRIGRLLARIMLANSTGARLVAVVVRKGAENDLEKRANLLRRDSVHGRFKGVISLNPEANQILANGQKVQVIYSNDPSSINYESYGIKNALLIDNTGKWRDEAGLSEHLKCPGVARVLLTAPGKGEIKNIVFGVNEHMIEARDQIISAASCTTNAITPVLKLINDRLGVVRGHVETIHSYTNDQNLIDNFHPAERRGRAAGLNMVITETGAATAVSKALPELEGLLTGNSIRVPTPNVSLAILNLELKTEIDRDALNQMLRRESLDGTMSRQIDYTDSSEVVSSDFIGSDRAGVVDSLATKSSGKNVIVYLWYDNESGYSHQVMRIAEEMLLQPVRVSND